MNREEFESNWRQMRGQIKRWWGILNDFDLDRADGRSDRLVELLQQKYGYTREFAEQEFNQWLKETVVY
jgi:uncharacterized protein YjbJ (UPF0337 family)